MSKISLFFQYHNAVPIALGLLFLGAGGAFAATSPETIFSKEETVVSVDNTYLVNKDLERWTPTAVVREVAEDEDNYYVTYEFSTIELIDYVWSDVVQGKIMTISKANLGEYDDLGFYVTKELKQKIDRTLAYLKEVQAIERKQVSLKQVATVYSGLIGKMLDNTTETLPGYVPVVTPPVPPSPPIVIAASAEPVLSPPHQVEPHQEVALPAPTVDAPASSLPSSIEPPIAVSDATSTATTTEIFFEFSFSQVATSSTTTPPQETPPNEVPPVTPSNPTTSAATEHTSPEIATSFAANPPNEAAVSETPIPEYNTSQ
ncbi:hypothetical protein HY418_03635 [Candidatus Kaiserbacteria bacterium]|nr:hypothetical protein [Candidatus Kaiserbacteria bacterium]